MLHDSPVSVTPPQGRRIFTVSALTALVKTQLETAFDDVWVEGEVSNLRCPPSGHLYFSLKDRTGQLRSVLFRTGGRRLKFAPADGQAVLARGHLTVYEPRGDYQLIVDYLEPVGLGALQAAFEQLKERLAAEGLFDAARKRPLPFTPRTIGIVTALRGAALHDILTVLAARFPNLHLIIRPAKVQGIGAANEVAAALDDLNRDARAEVIIVGRGGGSLEDLWTFNEESVARAIVRSRIPVISAVGHEIDYTIADFAADARAPTPTAAAQMVVPIKAELRQRIEETGATLVGAIEGALAAHRKHAGYLAARVRAPRNILEQARQRLDETSGQLVAAVGDLLERSRTLLAHLIARLRPPMALAREMRRQTGAHAVALGAAQRRMLELHRGRLAALASRLDSVSPLRVLERGYAVVTNRRDSRVVLDAGQVELGDELDIRLSRGRLAARVTARES
jgi:exodeoxyribonuclease VII large subunit